MPLVSTKTTKTTTTTADGKVSTSTTTTKTVVPTPASTATPDQPADTGLDWTQLSAEITADVEALRVALNVPGCSVGVVHKDKLVYSAGFGRRNDDGDAVDADTLFQIGSMSKSFTSLAYALLVDDKKVSWNTKVSEVYPATFADDVRTKFATIVDVLSHRMGLKHHFILVFIWSEYKELFERLPLLEAKMELREGFEYSNTMYSLAGAIIDELLKEEGGNWDSLIQKRIFDPLGMTASLTDLCQLPNQVNKSHGYHTVDDKVVPFPWEETYGPGGVSKAAGGICSNVTDYSKYLAFMLRKGKTEDGTQLVSAANFGKITNPITSLGTPVSRNPRVTFSYGMGWNQGIHRGKPALTHGGGTFGYTCDQWILPFDDLAVVVFTNSLVPLGTAACAAIIDRILFPELAKDNFWLKRSQQMVTGRDGYEKAMKQARIDAKDKDSTLSLPVEAYAGTYTSPLFGTLVLTAPVEGDKFFSFTLAGKPEYLEQKLGGLTGRAAHWEKESLGVHELVGMGHDHSDVPIFELKFDIVDGVVTGISAPLEDEEIVMNFSRV
ncbi:beta-lactamase/transpeptidase-like protein [Obelidium mucronatum]|nr:beta-lactamase/transpeptidase-like protein [Obelidium mucronatum]